MIVVCILVLVHKEHQEQEKKKELENDLLTNCINFTTGLPGSMQIFRGYTLSQRRRQRGGVILDLNIAETSYHKSTEGHAKGQETRTAEACL